MIFKNIDSNTINGLIICKEPPISSTEKRIQEIEIEGRDGTIVEELGYKSRTKPVEIGLKKNADVDKIISYFSGSGDLIFNCENDKIYKASIYKQVDLEKLIKFRKGTVEFYCQPFKYKRNDDYVIVNDNTKNDGNIYSKPIIRLEKNTQALVDVTINNIRFEYEFKTNDTYVEIDCEEMIALHEGLNRNRNLRIGYKFPFLNPGANTIVVNSGDATIKVKRKDRWL